jgi:hypothetical protein
MAPRTWVILPTSSYTSARRSKIRRAVWRCLGGAVLSASRISSMALGNSPSLCLARSAGAAWALDSHASTHQT